MDHLRLQSAFKFVAISRFGDGGQLMTMANLCLEAVQFSIVDMIETHNLETGLHNKSNMYKNVLSNPLVTALIM